MTWIMQKSGKKMLTRNPGLHHLQTQETSQAFVTGDNGFRQKSGILKIQFFIESRCPPPRLSNDIKYLYSPALDMR